MTDIPSAYNVRMAMITPTAWLGAAALPIPCRAARVDRDAGYAAAALVVIIALSTWDGVQARRMGRQKAFFLKSIAPAIIFAIATAVLIVFAALE
jgi:hypothetical protein